MTWSPIDCSKSDIVLDGLTKCEQTNSRSGPAGMGDYYSQRAQVSTSVQRTSIYVHKPRAALRTGGIGMITPEQREQWLAHPSQDTNRPGITFLGNTEDARRLRQDFFDERLAVLLIREERSAHGRILGRGLHVVWHPLPANAPATNRSSHQRLHREDWCR